MKRRGKKNARNAQSRGGAAKRRLMAAMRAVARITLAVVIVALTALGASAGFEAAKQRGYFKIERIIVDGARMVNEKAVIDPLGEVIGRNIFEFDLVRAGRKIESLPWIASVNLRRELPSTIRATIREREPAAVVEAGQQRFLVDEAGVVLQRIGPFLKAPLLLVAGLPRTAGKLAAGGSVDPAMIRDALAAARNLDGYRLFGAAPLESVEIAGVERLMLRFSGSNVVVTAPRRGWTDESQRLRIVDYILRGQNKPVASIDLTFTGKVIVTYPTGTNEHRG